MKLTMHDPETLQKNFNAMTISMNCLKSRKDVIIYEEMPVVKKLSFDHLRLLEELIEIEEHLDLWRPERTDKLNREDLLKIEKMCDENILWCCSRCGHPIPNKNIKYCGHC